MLLVGFEPAIPRNPSKRENTDRRFQCGFWDILLGYIFPHHTQSDSPGWVISPSKRLLSDNIQHSLVTDIHASGGIRNRNPTQSQQARKHRPTLSVWILGYIAGIYFPTPHSIGLPWMSDQPVEETSIWQHTIFISDRLSCFWWGSNPQSQQERELRSTLSVWILWCIAGIHFNIS